MNTPRVYEAQSGSARQGQTSGGPADPRVSPETGAQGHGPQACTPTLLSGLHFLTGAMGGERGLRALSRGPGRPHKRAAPRRPRDPPSSQPPPQRTSPLSSQKPPVMLAVPRGPQGRDWKLGAWAPAPDPRHRRYRKQTRPGGKTAVSPLGPQPGPCRLSAGGRGAGGMAEPRPLIRASGH